MTHPEGAFIGDFIYIANFEPPASILLAVASAADSVIRTRV